jgi:hypothetical protein
LEFYNTNDGKAGEYGLRFPMMGGGASGKYEPWHVELSGGQSGGDVTTQHNHFNTTITTQPGTDRRRGGV